MASITGGIPFIGFISPTDEGDQYPVTNPKYGLGGLRTVGLTTDLYTIPQERRERGMIVHTVQDGKYYHLYDGTADSDWQELSLGGGSVGPKGDVGPTGVQGFQGFQGLQGFQGFQGLMGSTGSTGVQGFQGLQGFQGFQGLMGSTGSTGVQGFQGFQGLQGFQGFQGLMGSTGSTGVQGFQGFQGLQGFQGYQGSGVTGATGPTGVQGATGPGLFDATYATGTNISNTINYNTIGNVTGTGRKFPVLLDDGSLTFDYIKTTDLFNSFTVSSFVLSGAASVLIAPSGSFSLNGRTFTASYTPAILSVASASISVNTTNSGYPLDLSFPYTSISANGTSIDYPTTKNTTITFTITATASDGSSDTATDTISFRQYNYWGVTSNSDITAGDLINLADNFGSKELLPSRSKTFTINAPSGQYIYYSYPNDYGTATFTVGGFAGGFAEIPSSGETHTNANGYQEKYRMYRSDETGLGNTTVVVS
jgi:hypothetical protein